MDWSEEGETIRLKRDEEEGGVGFVDRVKRRKREKERVKRRVSRNRIGTEQTEELGF